MSTGRLARVLATVDPQSDPAPTADVVARMAWLGLQSESGGVVTGRLSRAALLVPGGMSAYAGDPLKNLEQYATITLSGTFTGGDPPVTHEWVQISGPAVTLSATDAQTVTYTAPGTLAGASVVFGYRVSDDGSAPSMQSTVQHDVLPVAERAVVGGVAVPLRVLSVE